MDLGLDVGHVREHVRAALQHIDLWSPSAENIVLGTGVHESHLRYLKQLGNGPAIGLFQMEPFTYKDLWATYIQPRVQLAEKLRELASYASYTILLPPPAEEMGWNIRYAAAMCRVFYRRLPDALPAADDAHGMAALWKARYNTPAGKGTIEQALPAFELACGV